MADEATLRIFVTRGFVMGPGKISRPGDVLEFPTRVAWGFIKAGQAELATAENVAACVSA